MSFGGFKETTDDDDRTWSIRRFRVWPEGVTEEQAKDDCFLEQTTDVVCDDGDWSFCGPGGFKAITFVQQALTG